MAMNTSIDNDVLAAGATQTRRRTRCRRSQDRRPGAERTRLRAAVRATGSSRRACPRRTHRTRWRTAHVPLSRYPPSTGAAMPVGAKQAKVKASASPSQISRWASIDQWLSDNPFDTAPLTVHPVEAQAAEIVSAIFSATSPSCSNPPNIRGRQVRPAIPRRGPSRTDAAGRCRGFWSPPARAPISAPGPARERSALRESAPPGNAAHRGGLHRARGCAAPKYNSIPSPSHRDAMGSSLRKRARGFFSSLARLREVDREARRVRVRAAAP